MKYWKRQVYIIIESNSKTDVKTGNFFGFDEEPVSQSPKNDKSLWKRILGKWKTVAI